MISLMPGVLTEDSSTASIQLVLYWKDQVNLFDLLNVVPWTAYKKLSYDIASDTFDADYVMYDQDIKCLSLSRGWTSILVQ